jgi:hypothetical protein
VLETIFTPKFLAPDIVNLGFAQVYLTLMIDGIGSQPFSATTLPPIKPAQISYKDVIRSLSREQFAFPRAKVEEGISAWHQSGEEGVSHERTPQDRAPQERGTQERKREGTPYEKRSPSAPVEKRQSSTPVEKKVESTPAQTEVQTPLLVRERRREDDRDRERPRRQEAVQRPPQEKERRPVKESQQNSKSLEELRAVLRSISSQEPKQESKKETPSIAQQKEEVKSEKKAPEGSLRDALASVLETTQEPAVKVEPEVVPARSVSVPQPVAQAPRQEEAPKPQVPQTPVQPEVNEYAEKKNVDDPLSPKRLERMMRVTTSDKSPLV